MGDSDEDYEDYEYSDNGDDEYPLEEDGMEWNSSENPNAAPMNFRGE